MRVSTSVLIVSRSLSSVSRSLLSVSGSLLRVGTSVLSVACLGVLVHSYSAPGKGAGKSIARSGTSSSTPSPAATRAV